VSVNFIHLTGHTTFNIVGYKVLYAWPPVIRFNELDGFGNSRVLSSFRRVKMVKYTPSKIVIFHNNKGGVFPKVVTSVNS
jgi:hypothetical protein